MSNFYKEAKEKLERESKAAKYDRYASAMQKSVVKALLELASQDERFAESIINGGSFEECMKAVAKNCGNCISDLEAFSRAVRYFEPKTSIDFQMVLRRGNTSEKEKPDDKKESGAVIVDLLSML